MNKEQYEQLLVAFTEVLEKQVFVDMNAKQMAKAWKENRDLFLELAQQFCFDEKQTENIVKAMIASKKSETKPTKQKKVSKEPEKKDDVKVTNVLLGLIDHPSIKGMFSVSGIAAMVVIAVLLFKSGLVEAAGILIIVVVAIAAIIIAAKKLLQVFADGITLDIIWFLLSIGLLYLAFDEVLSSLITGAILFVFYKTIKGSKKNKKK